MEEIAVDNLDDLCFATYYNNKRAELNRAVFLSYLQAKHSQDSAVEIPKSAIVIKCGATWAKGGQKLSYACRKVLFEECLDSHLKDGQSHKADPFLCCFEGCQMTGTTNNDVASGDANGTTYLFERVNFKEGASPHKVQIHGYWVYAVDIEDVESIVLRWTHDSRFQGTYTMKPKQDTFCVSFPIVEFGKKIRLNTSMKIVHFPVLLNHATTGHKLQGKSMKSLIISQWSKVKNWAYVVLSRVRNITGLHFLSEIPNDVDFTPDQQYLDMMERLRESILATPADVADLMSQL